MNILYTRIKNNVYTDRDNYGLKIVRNQCSINKRTNRPWSIQTSPTKPTIHSIVRSVVITGPFSTWSRALCICRSRIPHYRNNCRRTSSGLRTAWSSWTASAPSWRSGSPLSPTRRSPVIARPYVTWTRPGNPSGCFWKRWISLGRVL